MDGPQLAQDAPWVVLKFGGTSVSTQRRWLTISELMRARRKSGYRVLIVVSALSGVTDALKGLIEAEGPAERRERAQALCSRHVDFVRELGIAQPVALRAAFARLDGLLVDPRAAAATVPWQAEVLGLGEWMSSAIGADFLSQLGSAVLWLDARDVLTSVAQPNATEWAQYLSANCAVQRSPAWAAQLAEQTDLAITQGFVARNVGGEPVVLGRGGSDTSAGYFGALLGAEVVEIWTDVPGMFSANPKRVPDARLIQALDYDEAQEIATTGAKVLHPRCIGPCRDAGVPILIRDTERPELPGTRIAASGLDSAPSVKALSTRVGVTMVSMESIGMWQQVGFLADVFATFKRHGLSIDLISSAETNVTVSLDPSENLINADTIQALCTDLVKVCRVRVIAPCAVITLVGRGIRSLLHRLAPTLAELGDERVHLISQSSNNLNLSLVVDESAVDALLPKLHSQLIASRVMDASDGKLFGPAWRALLHPPRIEAMLPWWRVKRDELLALAEQAPCYVYDLATVRAQARGLKGIDCVDRWFYAMKANAQVDVLRTLIAEGFGIECVSAAEIAHVLHHFPELEHDRVLFTPNFAPVAEYAQAFEQGVRVTVDNIDLLRREPGVFRGRHIIVRFDLGRGRGHHDKVKTGGARSKFGVALGDIAELRALSVIGGFEVVGLHAHLGSGILDVDHWRAVYSELATLAESFPHAAILNLGGGLGVPGQASEAALDLNELGRQLAAVKVHYPHLQLWLEPGRYLVAEAGVLLARVTQVKKKAGSQFVGLETGMNSLLRPALYDAHHDIVNLSRLFEAPVGTVDVVGPICETGDILGTGRLLPACVPGDLMLIATAGAYGAVMGSHYNLRAPAAERVL